MVQFDLPLEALRSYRNPRPEPAGFEEFWHRTLAESRAAGGSVLAAEVTTHLRTVTVHDVTFPGFGGEDVRGWWVLPTAGARSDGVPAPLPVVVEYLGYGGGRGLPHERILWASHGYAHLVVDSRGQGSIWNTGDTPDPHGSGPASPGMLTRGLDDPDNLYYRRLLTDAVLAVDAVSHLPGADPTRIATVGHSQGGAMALAAAALNAQVRATAARTPFLCGISRSVAMTNEPPYSELAGYLAVHRTAAEQAFAALDFVDVAFLAARLRCPTWISVGLADVTCPPSGIFAAINAIEHLTPEVSTWPYNGHEAGGAHDDAHLAGWLAEHLSSI